MDEGSTKSESWLSDEEFTALMSAEYAQQGKAVDEMARHRVWQRIEASTRVAPRRFPPAWMGAVAGLAALLVIPFLALQEPEDTMWRVKGAGPGAGDVALSGYLLRADSSLGAAVSPIAPGTTLVFQVDVGSPGTIALALARNDAPPSIRFVTEMLAGPQQPLAHASNAYGYIVEPMDRTLRFCAFAAPQAEVLEQQAQQLAAAWPNLPASQCVELLVQ